MITDEQTRFWLAVSESALSAIWDNEEDNVYAQLLKETRPSDAVCDLRSPDQNE